jgi:hypothetical protein
MSNFALLSLSCRLLCRNARKFLQLRGARWRSFWSELKPNFATPFVLRFHRDSCAAAQQKIPSLALPVPFAGIRNATHDYHSQKSSIPFIHTTCKCVSHVLAYLSVSPVEHYGFYTLPPLQQHEQYRPNFDTIKLSCYLSQMIQCSQAPSLQIALACFPCMKYIHINSTIRLFH